MAREVLLEVAPLNPKVSQLPAEVGLFALAVMQLQELLVEVGDLAIRRCPTGILVVFSGSELGFTGDAGLVEKPLALVSTAVDRPVELCAVVLLSELCDEMAETDSVKFRRYVGYRRIV